MSLLKFDSAHGRVSLQYGDLLVLRRNGVNGVRQIDGFCQPTAAQLNTLAELVKTRADGGSELEAAMFYGCSLRVQSDAGCVTEFGDIRLIYRQGIGWRATSLKTSSTTFEEALMRAVEAMPPAGFSNGSEKPG